MADNVGLGGPDLPIEIDEDDDEGLGSEIASSTTSLSSSVLRYEFENGRRYHGFNSGTYAFPNDEDELDRMDLENHLWKLLLDGATHLAPLRDPHKILDLGTGTGIWAIDMAQRYPGAQVIGTDLSPVQPVVVPANCDFEVDDFNLDWTWADNSIDFIHGRLLLASVEDYSKLFERAFAAIKPGGFMEMHEIDPGSYSDDGTLAPDSNAAKWGDLFKEGCAKAGRPILPVHDYQNLMRNAGFVNIREKAMKRPHNTWAKDKRLKRIGLVSKSFERRRS
jgi:ubiquinone/menaquinone biosynthesis C-methylase UbiE